jgi:multidrug transporter EmrE-like cation transporter
MNGRVLALVASSAVTTAVANLLLRAGVEKAGGLSLNLDRFWSDALGLAAQPLFVIGFIFYGIAAVLWFSVLPRADLSVTYPVLVALTFVLVVSGSVAVFHENLPWVKVVGLGLILVGVALVART